MAIDTMIPRTRRAILRGALGGAAAAAAAAVGRASPASAADDDAVLVGHTYSASTVTQIDAPNTVAIKGTSDSIVGVWGHCNSNAGVQGTGDSGFGVYGRSFGHVGVVGQTYATDWAAVFALAVRNGTGLQGFSTGNNDGTGSWPRPPAKTGVYGSADQDASARGVTGETTAGRGVNGIATTGTGVFGKSNSGEGIRGVSVGSNGTAGSSASGIASGLYGENTGGGYGTYGRSNVGATGSGVFGESTAGTGVDAATTTGVALRATSSGSGLAFKAQGRVAFSTAGLAVVAVGTASKTVKPGSDLVVGSLVLCTLESGQPRLAIQRVTKNTTANSFTVYLSAAVAAGYTAKVGWFVIG